MTLALKPRSREHELDRSGVRLFDVGPPSSLDESVSAAWEALEVRGEARCLVCGEPATRVGDGAAEACCSACGSRLT